MGIVICNLCCNCRPGTSADMLAYLRLIDREASKFGGSGWLTYDSVFHRNREGVSTLWNELDAALHQVYIANAAGSSIATPCKHCHEVDHQASECAVAAVVPKHQQTQPAPPHPQELTAPPLRRESAPLLTLNNGLSATPGIPGIVDSRVGVPMPMCAQAIMGPTQSLPARSTIFLHHPPKQLTSSQGT